jgi:cell division protein FtsQ
LLDRPLAAIDLRLPDRLVLRPTRQAEPAEQTAPRAGGARRG